MLIDGLAVVLIGIGANRLEVRFLGPLSQKLLLLLATDNCTRLDYLVPPALIGREPSKSISTQQHTPLNKPAFPPTQVTPGHDAERKLTRENVCTHSACLCRPCAVDCRRPVVGRGERHCSALSQLRKIRALAKREEKAIYLVALFLYPPTSLSLRLARPTAGLGVGTLFHC